MSTHNKKAQESIHWGFIAMMILALVAILFLIWLAIQSGQTTVKQLIPFQ